MGGGNHFHHPKYVWSPGGAWFAVDKLSHAKTTGNFKIAAVLLGVGAAGLFAASKSMEVRK